MLLVCLTIAPSLCVELDPQLREALTAEVLQLQAFEMIPDPLIGVEIGSVARQLFELHSSRRPACQKLLHWPRAMYRRAVPDNEQLGGDLMHQVLQKTHHIFTLEKALSCSNMVRACPQELSRSSP